MRVQQQQDAMDSPVLAVLAEEQWSQLGKRLRGVENSVQVSANDHSTHSTATIDGLSSIGSSLI